MVATSNRVGRNETCPCGSGKKYKKCCLVSNASPSGSASPLAAEPPTSSPRPTGFPRTSESTKNWNEVVFDVPLADGGRLHTVLLYSDGGLNVGLIRKGEVVTLDLPDIKFRGPATVVAIQRASAQGDTEAEVLRVVQFRGEDDMGKVLYGEWKPRHEFVERWKSRRRLISMRMDLPDGCWCDIQLLRTVKWMEQNGVHIGEDVFLDLTDVGVRGWAKVLEILPCGNIELGEGELITGTFRYSHGRVGELVLESEPKPIGVTPTHLFWSEDRQTWVEVSQLRPGETVQTMNGVTRVVSFTMTDRVEPVYNLEVSYDHCYRVGESGVLVHNQSCGEYLVDLRNSNNTRSFSPGISNASDFQSDYCGSTEYHISSGSTAIWADGIRDDGCVVLDCKYPENPETSAQLGRANEYFTMLYKNDQLRELRKYETVISDSCNPLTKLTILCVSDAVPFWTGLASQLSIDVDVLGV